MPMEQLLSLVVVLKTSESELHLGMTIIKRSKLNLVIYQHFFYFLKEKMASASISYIIAGFASLLRNILNLG